MGTFEKPKSKLFRPDPYYIPGYCGYCPMKKYQLGETYGKTTANILTDSSIAKSGQLVLAEKKVRGEESSSKVEPLKSMRDNAWGDRKLNSSMVPGDTRSFATRRRATSWTTITAAKCSRKSISASS